MRYDHWIWKRFLAATAASALVFSVRAGEPIALPLNAPTSVVQTVTPMGLGEVRRQAIQDQPALKAYRASAAAAEEKLQALDKMKLAALIRRDLPTRREQAEQGVVASHAQLDKAEWDTVYAVTRTYLSVLYARKQLSLADEALDKNSPKSLYYIRELAAGILKDKDNSRRDVKQANIDGLDALIETTIGKRQDALQGVERARAALREAIGLEYDCPLALSGTDLPSLSPKVDRDAIVQMALDRRGEMKQAAAGLEVTSLEIKAQKRIFGLRGETFGMGSDLHAEAVPQGFANGEYRPGAITIEMPPQVVGKRHARIGQVESFQGRAAAVVDKTRHLVTLEAEDAYYHWVTASTQAVQYARAAQKATAAADQFGDPDKGGFNPGDKANGRPSLEELVEARVKAVQLKLLANQAQFQALVALAALERVTAGGFDPGFDRVGIKP